MNNKKILNIPNTSSINLFGKIINNYFTLSSTQESNINIGPFFIEHIILYTSNKFRSQQDTMTINTGKISKFITYRAKLLNADWLRQRAVFLNFPSMEGKITRF